MRRRLPVTLASLFLVGAAPADPYTPSVEPDGYVPFYETYEPPPHLAPPTPAAPQRPVIAPEAPERVPHYVDDAEGSLTNPSAVLVRRVGEYRRFSWYATTTVRDPEAAASPVPREEDWRLAESVQVPVIGPFFVFGQLDAGSRPASVRELQLVGRTGVALQLPTVLGADVILRGGPLLYCTDPHRPELLQDQAELLVELQCRLRLLGNLDLEYQGVAIPAIDPTARERLSQDLGLALPVGEGGLLRLGARHYWDGVSVQRAWTENMQLYLGLEIGR